MLNASGSMAVNLPGGRRGSFVVFAGGLSGVGEFAPGNTLTVTATFSDGSTATATTTVAATPPSEAATLTLAYTASCATGWAKAIRHWARTGPGRHADGQVERPWGTNGDGAAVG